MSDVRFLWNGDSALSVEFGNEISPSINARVQALRIAIEQHPIPGVVETVPSYRALMVCYQPKRIGYERLVSRLKDMLDRLDRIVIPPSEVLEIPVLYGGEMGPDLEFVAQHAGKTEAEVVEIHSAPEYLIYMLGFAPGFTYLGGMNQSIATPRLETPRICIPAGSVGIAGSQTGIYPVDSPGGWQLIGRTPVCLYNPDRAVPILPQAGQYIKFYPIDQAEYERIVALERHGGYHCRSYPRGECEG